MSSFIRTLQRAALRKKYFGGRGSMLGTANPQDRSRKAREARERRRAARRKGKAR